jgi:NAD(P)-dependent dehydrogenase (short-subunit alcohol dehydrogenase family)
MRMIITGAASGMGRATALLAAAEPDTQLVLVDRAEAALAAAADEVRAAGAEAVTVVADLSVPESSERIVAAAEKSFGGLDALISNAGMNPVALLKDLDVAAFDAAFAVNTRPAWLLGKAAHAMLSESRGAIVATGSMSATQPTPPLGAYSASKAALVMLVQQMALEWGPDGIRCNVVSPGPTVTGMTVGVFNDTADEKQRQNREARERHIPLRRVGLADDVARAILFLASDAAHQITGVNLLVDGGLSLGLMPAVGGGQGHDTK